MKKFAIAGSTVGLALANAGSFDMKVVQWEPCTESQVLKYKLKCGGINGGKSRKSDRKRNRANRWR